MFNVEIMGDPSFDFRVLVCLTQGPGQAFSKRVKKLLSLPLNLWPLVEPGITGPNQDGPVGP